MVLFGYAFFGRSFAYLGVPPLYVGEAALAVGVIAVLSQRGIGVALRSPVVWLWLALATWCAVRTVPYVGTYGMDALRDAALPGYGAFALFVAMLLERAGSVSTVFQSYGRWLPLFTLWAPTSWAVSTLGGDNVPRLPGTTVPVLEFNPSCAAVHLAGVGAFLLLGLHPRDVGPGKHTRRSEMAQWILWFLGVSLVATWTRGGALAVLVSIVVVLVARPSAGRKLAFVGVVALMTTLTFAAFDLSFDTGSYRGRISPQEVVANLTSIFRPDVSDQANREGNRTWRLEWWNKILGYTVYGDRFWVGKGFGINLADDDGFQVTRDHSLRSPHNGHLTFLARGGVPAGFLWVVLQCTFGLSLLRAFFRARRVGNEWWQRIDIWILAYWLAFLVNAAFDVFLEGPQGGIWFWSLFGFGIAAVEAQRRLFSSTSLPPRSVELRSHHERRLMSAVS